MKLHLPKFLLTAVLAVYMTGVSAGAGNWGSNGQGGSANSVYYVGATETTVDATSGDQAGVTELYLSQAVDGNGANGSKAATIQNLLLKSGDTMTVQDHPWKSAGVNFSLLTINQLTIGGGTGSAAFNVNAGHGVQIDAVSGSISSLCVAGTLTLGTNALTNIGAVSVASGGTLDLSSIDLGDEKQSTADVHLVSLMNKTAGAGEVKLKAGTIIQTGNDKTDVSLRANYVVEGDATSSLFLASWAPTTGKVWRVWDVSDGGSLQVGENGNGTLYMSTQQRLSIQAGGTVKAGSLILGHDSAANNPGSILMTGGELTVQKILGRNPYGSEANEVTITGGTLKVTGTDAVGIIEPETDSEDPRLNVSIGGTGEGSVILQTKDNDWVLDGSSTNLGGGSLSIGNVTIDAANTKLITFKNASLSGNIVNNAQLAIGAVSFVSGSVLTLNEGSNLTLDNAGTIIFNNYDSNAGIKATGSGTLTVGSGTIVQLTNSEQKKEAAVAGTIKVQGGGKLLLSGSGKSLLGYDEGGTDAIYLAGEDNNLASMEITTTANQHLSTDLYLQGYAQIIGSGTIESYQQGQVGKIYVKGVSNKIDANIALNRTLTINVAKDGELVVNGVMSAADGGTKDLIKEGAGTLTLSGNNTYTGTTTVSGGKVVVSGGRLGKGDVTITNAEVELNGAGTTGIGQKNSKVTINEGGKLTLKGQDALGYDKNNNTTNALGKLVLSGGEGTATLNIQDTASLTLTTNVEMKGNSQITGKKFNTFGTGFTVSGSNNIIDAATLELRKKWNVDVLAGGKLEISSEITDHSDDLAEAQLIKKGAGILVLSGSVANEYTSATTIEAGVLQLKKADALGDGAVEIQSKGTLELSGADVTVSSLAVDGGKVQTNSNQLTVSGATTVTSNGGTMQGAVQLNSLSVDGKLKIGDGSTKGVIISNLNSQTTGTLGGTITSDAANTTISLAGADVDNKAIISNALIDIMEESTFKLSNAVVADTSRITDAAAKLIVTNVQMDVTVGTNATAEASTLPNGGVTLQKMGGSETVTVAGGTNVLAISSSLMDTVTVSGSGLTINLNGLYGYGVKNYGYVSLTFTNEDKTAASFSTGLGVNIAYAGSILSAPVYFDTAESSNTTLYVKVTDQLIDAAAVPEPTTTTLSLLALAGLAARRRRK